MVLHGDGVDIGVLRPGRGEYVLDIPAVARLRRILFAGCRDRPELVRGGDVQGVDCDVGTVLRHCVVRLV